MLSSLEFIVLCPDKSLSGLQVSLKSISSYAYNRKSIAVLGSNANPEELAAFQKVCPTFQGDKTITSLLNVGMSSITSEWGLVIFAGSKITPSVERKLNIFIHKPTDIAFPVVNGKYNFIDGSFNGVLFNSHFFKIAGDFPLISTKSEGINDFELAKMLWVTNAVKLGAEFKAIVGLRVS